MTISTATTLASPFGKKLTGRGAIAAYHYGQDTPQNRRRISALMREVREENRIPYGIDGDGRPFTYTRWLDEYDLSRCQNRLKLGAAGG
jgi:hypothetical protein